MGEICEKCGNERSPECCPVVPPEERGDGVCGSLPPSGVDSGGGSLSDLGTGGVVKAKRKNRNEYMRLYMKARRERQKKAKDAGGSPETAGESQVVQGEETP